MKVSVIIPVYNAELYLDRCIASVIGQSHRDWEMVLVDDVRQTKVRKSLGGGLRVIVRYGTSEKITEDRVQHATWALLWLRVTTFIFWIRTIGSTLKRTRAVPS